MQAHISAAAVWFKRVLVLIALSKLSTFTTCTTIYRKDTEMAIAKTNKQTNKQTNSTMYL